jgi:hypothetical protein
MKMYRFVKCAALVAVMSIGACAALEATEADPVEAVRPAARWDHVPQSGAWTDAALVALQTHGQPLVTLVPRDIEAWCPAFAQSDFAGRSAFWVGLLSALSRYESTFKPEAVNPNGKWFGLLQISPATARGYGCVAGSGAALTDGPANLSCAIRILATTVPRDGVVHARDSKWRGVSADWGPMRVPSKREEIRGWVRQQDYCTR